MSDTVTLTIDGQQITVPAGTTILNAANEVAVESFLNHEIPFQTIAEIVGESVERTGAKKVAELGDVLDADRETREVAHELVRQRQTTVKGYSR